MRPSLVRKKLKNQKLLKRKDNKIKSIKKYKKWAQMSTKWAQMSKNEHKWTQNEHKNEHKMSTKWAKKEPKWASNFGSFLWNNIHIWHCNKTQL